MFDIGFWELATIGLLVLIVLGPKRLPEVARTAGRWAQKARRFVENVKHDIDLELNSAELAELKKIKQELTDARQDIEQSTSKVIGRFQEDIDSLTVMSDESSHAHTGARSKKLSTRKKSPVKKRSLKRKARAQKNTAKKKNVKTT